MVISRNQPLLVVEDSPEDREATSRALRKAGVTSPILFCTSGDDALDFLHARGKYAETSAVRPAVILLDLNMPGTDGREVLAEIKANAALKSIPVVVITTSRDERDIHTCYESGCNAYVRKPVDLGAFMLSMQRLSDFWFGEAILP